MRRSQALFIVWLPVIIVVLLALIDFAARAHAAQLGKASWYGPGFAGRLMSNGKRFDPLLMTCAHRFLPLGTVVRVTRLDNGRAIRCQVTDRGPFINGRIIDLSQRAAMGLGMVQAGTARVKVEVLR